MRRVEVVLYDNEPWPSSLREVGRTTTDDNGNYVFAGVSNNGFLFGGLNVYVEVLSTNLKTVYDLSTHVALTKPSNGAGYAADTPQTNNVPDGSTVDYGIRYPTQYNEAWESVDAILREYDWVKANSGTGWTRQKINILWPYGTWPAFCDATSGGYCNVGNGQQAPSDTIALNDRSDPASYGPWNHYVLYHEYGHAVMFTAYGNSLPSGAGPPPSDPCYPNHCIFSETSGQYALVEGFAEFMQAAVDNSPESVGAQYYNGHGGNLETNDWYNCVDTGDIDGNVVEGSVASVFWDIFDPVNDDPLSLGFGPIWNVLANSQPQQLYPDFWNAWFQRYDYSSEMTQIFVNYGVLAPTVTVTSILTQSSTSYSYRTTTTTVTSYTSTTTSTSTVPAFTTVVLVPLTITSTEHSTQFLTSTLTTTTTSYTGTSTLTSTIPTTVALVASTVTSIVQSIQYLTSVLSTTVTSYTSTQASTSTIVVPTTVVLVPVTTTSTVQSTQFLTSTATTTVTNYTDTQTLTSTIPATTTVVLVPSTVTSTAQSTQYLTSVLTTTVTSYTDTSTSTSTSVVYTTVTVSRGSAGAAGSSPLTYLSFLSLLAVTVGHRVKIRRTKRIPKVQSASLPPTSYH